MSAIWKHPSPGLDALNAMRRNTLAEDLDMEFTGIGPDFLKLQMPVNNRTHQPYGLLHGGASAALAETLGSVASSLCIDVDRQICGAWRSIAITSAVSARGMSSEQHDHCIS